MCMNPRDASFCCAIFVDNIISFGSDSEQQEPCNRLRKKLVTTLHKCSLLNKRMGPFKTFQILYCLLPLSFGQ